MSKQIAITKDNGGSCGHICRECVYYKRVDWMLISLCCNNRQEERMKIEPDNDACELFEGSGDELQAD